MGDKSKVKTEKSKAEEPTGTAGPGKKPRYHFAFEFNVEGKVKRIEVDANSENEGMDLARQQVGPEARYTQSFRRTENK